METEIANSYILKMAKKRKIGRRFNQLRHDLIGITKNHGFKISIFYLIVKIVTKLPLLSAIFKKACGQKLLVKVLVLDSWMYLNLFDPGISYQLIVNGIREPGHVEQVRDALKAGMKGIDIGANIGYYVLLEAQLVGLEGRIFCIEPAPDNFSLLKKNVLENNFDDRVTCFQYLVGDKNGPEKLFLSEAANSHSIAAISGRSVELPMVTIDHFLATKHINPEEIDFLRMDIEGYEVMVLQHMQTLLANRKKPLKLFIELHPSSYEQWGWTLEKFINYLMSLGFIPKSVVEREIDEQGLINERAVSMVNGVGLAEVLKRTIKKENESGFLDNWFLELPPR